MRLAHSDPMIKAPSASRPLQSFASPAINIVGIKTAHYSNPDWIAIDRSIEAGRLTDRPIIVDSGILTTASK